jgi:hypothetical protein
MIGSFSSGMAGVTTVCRPLIGLPTAALKFSLSDVQTA